MKNIIVIMIIAAIICAAIAKIIIEKKKGVKCIGCPNSGTGKNQCGCNISK